MVVGVGMILGALSLALYNAWDEKRASSSVADILPQVEQVIEKNSGKQVGRPNTGDEMATVVIDGNEYIGILEIPSIGTNLPVLSSWSYPLLKISPCRYSGSVGGGALVIAAHNYAGHFAKLVDMEEDDHVYFTDVNGIVYKYAVAEVTTLQKTQIEEMKSSEWDLTLFTCDYRGRLRIAVRCKMMTAY